MPFSFFWIHCSLKRLTTVISHLHGTKLMQSLTFARNITLLRHQTTSTEAVCAVPVKMVSSDLQSCGASNPNVTVSSSDIDVSNKEMRILSSVNMKMLPFEIVNALKALRLLAYAKKGEIKHIHDSQQFKKLCDMFEHYSHLLPSPMLISGLRSLLEIGISPSNDLVNNLELIILWKIKNFNITELIGCLHLHSKYLSTDRQKQVVATLIKEIIRRVPEISFNAEVFMLIQSLHLFDQQLLKQLQTQITSLFSYFQSKDLSKAICSLAENSQRNIILLNAAGFYLMQNNEKPNLKETVNILYALKKLNYLNAKLLSHLTVDRETEISIEERHSVIAGLLSASGQLKYRCPALLEACGSWILNHIDTCCPRVFVSYLLTIAALNYIPNDSSIINTVMSHLNFKDVSKEVWLDVVHSLAVLNFLDKKLLLYALSKEFYTTLLETDNSVSNKLKLLNLKALLKLHYPEFVLSCDLVLDAPKVPMTEEVKATKELVLTALNKFIPRGKFMCTHRNSDTGILIDAEFIMGMNGKPLPLSDYGLMSEPSIDTKDLPAGAKRVALMIWLYKDFTLNEKTLTGINALASRTLSDLGFVVVEVLFEEFVTNTTEVKQVTYLSQAINSVLQGNKSNVFHSNK